MSYCFDPDKVAACRAAEALGSNDIAAFPIPDLAVEIDIAPRKIDRADIYSKLRAPEVWRFSNDAVSIEQLDASGKYVAADASRFLRLRADEVTQWLREGRSTTQPTWKRAVREWSRAVLRPRAGL